MKRVCAPSSPVREREGEREKGERESEREKERERGRKRETERERERESRKCRHALSVPQSVSQLACVIIILIYNRP